MSNGTYFCRGALKCLGAACLITAGSYSPLVGQALFAPVGGEYPVTPNLPGDQMHPDLALSDTGGYIVWQDNFTDGHGLGISAQRITANFSALHNHFRVNETAEGDQENAQVALFPDGSAAVVWQSGELGFQDIYLRMISPDGTFSTGEIRVNTFVANDQRDPALAVLSSGNLVVVWSSYGQELPPGSMAGVFGQIIDASGRKVGEEFQVNRNSIYNQRKPVVAPLADGGFLAGWISESLYGIDSLDVAAGLEADSTGGIPRFQVNLIVRVYYGQEARFGPEIKVNQTDDYCSWPDLAVGPDGKVMSVWMARGSLIGPKRLDIFGRLLTSDGTPLGQQILINQHIDGDQYLPRVTAHRNQYLVVWNSLWQEQSYEEVYGRLLQANGAGQGDEFRVNTTIAHKQLHPVVASDGGNQTLVAWTSFNPQTSFDLTGQIYSTSQILASPVAPFVTALSPSQLSVTWPIPGGRSVVHYEVYMDNWTQPEITLENHFKTTQLAASSTHTFKYAYRLDSGELSPLSEIGSGSTWSDDGNFNGLPDNWERLHFGEDRKQWPAPWLDSDGDGADNLQEFLAGTNPADAASSLALWIESTPQGPRVNWNSIPGNVYQLQISNNLQQWDNHGSYRFAVGDVDSLPAASDSGVAYYRIIRIR